MVEYKKKKIILQSGGTRNYYYKVTSNGKKKQVSKNEYFEKKGGFVQNDPHNQTLEQLNQTLEQLIKTLNTLKANNPSNVYIDVLNGQIKDIEKKIKIKNRLSKYNNIEPTILLEKLNKLIDMIPKVENRNKYQLFHDLVIEIFDRKIEILDKYAWKEVFDDVKKKHFNNNGNIVKFWSGANTWEDSFVTSFWKILFH